MVARTGVLRDITEQKVNEERLRKSEELYYSLAEASQDLIYIINADDRIEYADSAQSLHFGRTYDEHIDEDRGEIFSSGINLIQPEHLLQVFTTGKPRRLESQIPEVYVTEPVTTTWLIVLVLESRPGK